MCKILIERVSIKSEVNYGDNIHHWNDNLGYHPKTFYFDLIRGMIRLLNRHCLSLISTDFLDF